MSAEDAVLWRGMTRAQIDAAYNNSAAVANSAETVADWTQRTAALRAATPDLLDLAYGPRPRNRIDVFRCGARDAPLFVFLHGGYWQRNSKEVQGCMATGPLSRGFEVAMVGYTLSPEATLGEIIAETHEALRWLRRQARIGIGEQELLVCGWSAGGHLAATAMGLPEVDAGIAISGIFDLEPCRLNYLNDKLRLTPGDVLRHSPIVQIPKSSGPLTVAYGTRELPELRRQSHEYHAAWTRAGNHGVLLALEHDHFSILTELSDPGGALAEASVSLISEVREARLGSRQ